MTQILFKLSEEYENTIENLEEKLDDNIYMLGIKIIWDKLSAKYNRMNEWYNENKGKELDNLLYVHQIKLICYNCGKHIPRSRYYIEGKQSN